MPSMLYYPFANAPLEVATRALLYWDGLSTVVAPDWEERIQPHMAAIKEREFYRPVESITTANISLNDIGPEIAYAISKIDSDELRLPKIPPDPESDIVLHAEKIHESIIEHLVELGLAARHPQAPWRLYGSPQLLYVVISVVAARIAADANRERGSQGVDSFHPHTDQVSAYRLCTDPVTEREVSDGWRLDIGPLLPVPTAEVMIRDLWDFREDHKQAREDLMWAITDLLQNLKDKHPRDAYAHVERHINKARRELSRQAKQSGIPLIARKGMLVTVAGVADFVGQRYGVPPGVVSTLATISGLSVNIASAPVRQLAETAHDFRYIHILESEMRYSGLNPAL